MSHECAQPLPDQTLLDWWVGDLAPADQRAAERHLLGCSACSARAEVFHSVGKGVRDLVRRGRLTTVVTEDLVEQLRGEGRKIREYRVEAGGSVQCTVAPDDDLVLARLGAALGDSRVDLLVQVGDGEEERLRDLPCLPGAHEIVLAVGVDRLQAAPAHVQRLRLVAVEGTGERVLGEYTFDHRPWPGWPDATAS